jgi:flagellar hook assembly protein FlgD
MLSANDDYVVPEGKEMSMITIYPNFPNPFREATKIRYTLNENAYVKVIILDFAGKVLVTLEDSEKTSGYYENEWNGSKIDNGLYLYRIVVRNQKNKNTFTGKIFHLK